MGDVYNHMSQSIWFYIIGYVIGKCIKLIIWNSFSNLMRIDIIDVYLLQ